MMPFVKSPPERRLRPTASAKPLDDPAALYGAYALLLPDIAVRRFGVPQDAAVPLVQDIFVTYLQRAGVVRNPGRYLVASICNASRQYWRRQNTRRRAFQHDIEDVVLGQDARRMLSAQLAIAGTLSQLEPTSREILRRYYVGKESDRFVSILPSEVRAAVRELAHEAAPTCAAVPSSEPGTTHLRCDDVLSAMFGPQGRDSNAPACPTCASALADYSLASTTLRETTTWAVVEVIENGSAIGTALAQAEAQIKSDTAAAADRIAPLLTNRFRFAWAQVAMDAANSTLPVVRVLCRAAYDACDSAPLLAAEAANAAITICTPLEEAGLPGASVLLGTAWKERANAHRFLGELDLSLDALDQASRVFKTLVDSSYDLAIVGYIRATVLVAIGRPKEAAIINSDLAATFSFYGDDRRAKHCDLLDGYVAYKEGSLHRALSLWRGLLREADETTDSSLIAHLRLNCANVMLRLEQVPAARKELRDALLRFRRLQIGTEVTRAEWQEALALLASGNMSEAVARLEDCARAFEVNGMLADAACVHLDISAGLRGVGRNRAAARHASVAARMLEALKGVASGGGTDEPQLARVIRTYLDDCYSRRSSARVSELADFLKIGRQHLNRLCQAYFGTSAHEALRIRQLQHAQVLLMTSSLPTAEIACAGGFGTESTFFRQFNAHYGMTPDEFRNHATKR